MESRTAAVLVAALGICCVGLVLSVTYPFALRESQAANPTEERFGFHEPAVYEASGRIVADGETALAVTAVRTTGGTRYLRVREPGVVSETYQADTNATAYVRFRVADADQAASLRADIEADPDRTLREATRADGRTTFVVAETASGALDRLGGAVSVVVRSLQIAAYDRTDRTGSRTIYAPRDGWYGGRSGYRLTDATGSVRTTDGSRAVVAANVSWTVTRPADTYAAYALARLTGSGVTRQRLTLDVDDEPGRIERPGWVPDREAAEDK